MKLAPSFFTLIAVAATVSAQTKAPHARQFLFDGYTTAMSLDMKKVRDTGAWDEINVSTMKMIFGLIEKQCGFPLDRLDRTTLVRERAPDGQERRAREVIIIEGNGDLGQPKDVESGRYATTAIGDYSLMVDQWSASDQAMVKVTPKLRVLGPTELVTDVLKGKPRGGLPSGDVMSFTAAKKGLLGYIVADLENDDSARLALKDVLPDAEWPADDKPTFICIRLLVSGEEDDPHLKLEVVLRHGKDGEGLVASEKAVADALQKVKKIKETRIIWPILRKIQHERDRTDAIWRVDLGRARNVGGMLGTLSPFLMFSSASSVAPAQRGVILEIDEEVEEPKPVKKKAKPKTVEVTRKKQPKAKVGN